MARSPQPAARSPQPAARRIVNLDIKQISSAYISKLTQLEQEQCLLKEFMILQRWFSIHSVK